MTTGPVDGRGTCERCGRSDRRLYRLRRSWMADEPEGDVLRCLRCRVIRRFRIFWIWVFRVGEGFG